MQRSKRHLTKVLDYPVTIGPLLKASSNEPLRHNPSSRQQLVLNGLEVLA